MIGPVCTPESTLPMATHRSMTAVMENTTLHTNQILKDGVGSVSYKIVLGSQNVIKTVLLRAVEQSISDNNDPGLHTA